MGTPTQREVLWRQKLPEQRAVVSTLLHAAFARKAAKRRSSYDGGSCRERRCAHTGVSVTCDAAIAFAMRISQSRKSAGWLAGWRLAFSRFWLAYTSWSGVEWSGRHSFLPRAGWPAIYLSLFQHWRIGAIGIPRELWAVGCVRFVGGGLYIYWFAYQVNIPDRTVLYCAVRGKV